MPVVFYKGINSLNIITHGFEISVNLDEIFIENICSQPILHVGGRCSKPANISMISPLEILLGREIFTDRGKLVMVFAKRGIKRRILLNSSLKAIESYVSLNTDIVLFAIGLDVKELSKHSLNDKTVLVALDDYILRYPDLNIVARRGDLIDIESLTVLLRNSNLHEMRLDDYWLNLMALGMKTIEVRLWDEKRRKLRRGDYVLFRGRKSNKMLFVKILDLKKYGDIKELLELENVENITPGFTIDEAVNIYSTYYSKQEMKEFGLVAIEVSPL